MFEILDTSHPSTSAPVVGPIRAGVRERTLMSVLGAARRRGAVEAELRALAQAMNTRCKPPLDKAALDRMARSIARYAPEPDDLNMPELLASVPPAGGKTPTAHLVFQTPVDLFATRERHLDYVLAPYLIADALTDFTGPAKAGKTRFRNYLIRCLVNGESCLGYPACEPSPAVLLTEEPGPALWEGLEAAGLTGTRDLHVLTRYAARDADWPALVAAADAKAKAVGARLLIVDTLPAVARLAGDAENSSGHALAAMRPLQETQTPGLAKFIIRHTRKGGGDLVEKGRGSSAFAGGADVLMSISWPKKSGPTVRRLEALGRFDAIPPVLTVERVTHAIGKSSPPTDPHFRIFWRATELPMRRSHLQSQNAWTTSSHEPPVRL